MTNPDAARVLVDLLGGQDLPADRLGHNPRGDVHGLPEQVAVVLGDLAGVDADADLDSALRVGDVVLMQGAWMAAAARTAATVDGKEMRNPSPRDLHTRPPNAMTLSCTISACDPRMSSGPARRGLATARLSRRCRSS